MTIDDFQHITVPSAFQLLAFESLDSTNDELRRRAMQDAADGTVVCALEQTKGRGRRGRTWTSEPGNLFCSILKRPSCPLKDAAQLSFVSALAIHGAVKEATVGFDCDVQCKWPNDVLIDGYKISGILLESQAQSVEKLDWMIIGIGVNLLHSPANTPYPSGYIGSYRQKTVTPQAMLEILLKHFLHWFDRWQTVGFTDIRRAWLENAKGVGEEITVNLANDRIKGIFETLDPDGALVLGTPQGQRIITAGDVFFGS